MEEEGVRTIEATLAADAQETVVETNFADRGLCQISVVQTEPDDARILCAVLAGGISIKRRSHEGIAIWCRLRVRFGVAGSVSAEGHEARRREASAGAAGSPHSEARQACDD